MTKKSQIRTTSALKADPIEMNLTVKNNGISKSYNLHEKDLMVFDPELYTLLNTLRSVYGTDVSAAVKDFIHCLF